jgi:uncharacterized protein
VKKILLLLVAIPVVVFFLPLKALDLPALKGYVNDYAGIISPAAKEKLATRMEAIEASDSTQIAIVTVNSLEGIPIEDFGIQLAEKWKIGRAKKDNGVLFIVSKGDKKMRIEVGRGLEGVLTDLRAGRIIDTIVRPRFQSGDFDAGFLEGTEAIISACRGEFKNDSPKSSSKKGNGIGTPLILIMIAVYFAIVMLSTKSRILAAGVGAAALPLIVTFGLFSLGLIGIIIAGVVGLILGFIIPMIPIGGGGSSSGGGFWSGGSGSGGGFSGGGGSFGGGGSSGGW